MLVISKTEGEGNTLQDGGVVGELAADVKLVAELAAVKAALEETEEDLAHCRQQASHVHHGPFFGLSYE